MKYHIEILKWNGDKCEEPIRFDTLEHAEDHITEYFGEGERMEWMDTQMGFQLVEKGCDYNMLFARGGPVLWELSLFDEDGIIEWDERIISQLKKGE